MSITRKLVSDPGLHVAPGDGKETNRDGLEPAQSYPQYSEYPQQHNLHSPKSTHNLEQREATGHSRKKFYGIPALSFWFLLAFIIVLLAAIAVIGGVLGSRHATSLLDPTSAATMTVTKTPPPTTVTRTASAVSATSTFACTSNGTVFTSSTGSTFTTLCSQSLGVGKTWNNSDVDLTMVQVSSYGACIDACALSRYENIKWNNDVGSCMAVDWESAGSTFGYCRLKNGTGTPIYNAVVEAAILLTA